jgi:putative addiction module killer protein
VARVDSRPSVSYSRHLIEILSTEQFDKWLKKLKDRAGRLRILERIDRLAHGNPGDVKPVGQGVAELRLTYGPGYRVYYLQDGDTVILLLVGGDKSTQQRDISKAHELADEWHADQKKKKEEDGDEHD